MTAETNNKQRELIKTYVPYNDLDTLMSRKKIIIDTVINAINRENLDEGDFILSYNDSKVLINENNKYVLMILINKDYK